MNGISSIDVGQSNAVSGWRGTARRARQDFEQLFQALRSGDTAGAQKPIAQLGQDLQSSGQALGVHRHHGGLGFLTSLLTNPAATMTSAATATTTNAPAPTGTAAST